jgi:hypothetical protein
MIFEMAGLAFKPCLNGVSTVSDNTEHGEGHNRGWITVAASGCILANWWIASLLHENCGLNTGMNKQEGQGFGQDRFKGVPLAPWPRFRAGAFYFPSNLSRAAS